MTKPLLLTLMTGLLSSCAMLGIGNQNLSTSPALPASEGKVTFKKTDDGNTAIRVKVEHLAHPQKLTPPANTYVVWTRKDKDADPQNVGALSVDKRLTGTLTTVTPMRSFEVFITAEGVGTVEEPTGEPLLWASYSR